MLGVLVSDDDRLLVTIRHRTLRLLAWPFWLVRFSTKIRINDRQA
jgi:hypothetical protein